MKRLFTVFSFTFKEAVRNKGFIISTIITLVILFGFANLDKIKGIFDDGSKEKVLVFQDSKERLLNEASVDKFDNDEYDFIYNNNISDLNKEEEVIMEGDSDYKALLLIDGKGEVSGKLFVNKDPGSTLKGKVNEIVNGIKVSEDIKKFNLSSEEYRNLMTPANVEVVQGGKSSNGRMMLVYVLIFMLYGGMIGLGSMVAMSVLEEKTSRIMESLITMAKPLELFFGKVLGICAVGVVQYGIIIGFGAITLKNSEMMSGLLDTASLDFNTIAAFIVFFLIGYLTFALLYGAVGSLATSMQDANSALAGITYIIIAVLFISIQCIFNVEAGYAVVFSYMPFTSPLVMFERIILSNVGIFEVCISIFMNLVYIFAIGWLSSKVYNRGTLHYGTKLSLIKVIKEMRK